MEKCNDLCKIQINEQLYKAHKVKCSVTAFYNDVLANLNEVDKA